MYMVLKLVPNAPIMYVTLHCGVLAAAVAAAAS
jgi:hypothetical protein